MSDPLAAFLLPPLVPAACLVLLLWLDRVERVLEGGPTKATPAGEPITAARGEPATTEADRPAGVLAPVVAD